MNTPTPTPTCGELSCDECNARTAALTADRDQLRAEVELDEALQLATERSLKNAIARAERAEAEVQRLKADGAASAFVDMACRASRAETDRDQLRAEVERLRSDRDCEKRLRKDAEELREDAIARAARAERAEAEVSKLTDALDMMRDEFMRIIACPGCNAEIEDLANRAQLKLIQRVPVITQRDRAETELAKERARLDWLESDAGVDWQWNDAGGGIVFRAKIDAAMKEETK